MLRKELKQLWQNKMLLLTTVVICFIPILYAAIFLKSVWDPYSKLDQIPVAVVNQDQPVDYQGKRLNVGRDAVEMLKKDDSFKWDFVSAETADQGMKDNKYYVKVTLPRDFSAKAATMTSVSPEQMNLNFETNGSLNFPLQTISESGLKQLKSSISQQVTLAYANAVISSIKQTGDQLQTATNGAQLVASGAGEVDGGANQLNIGANQLKNGTKQLASQTPILTGGVWQLATGSDQLNNGVNQLVNQTRTSGQTLQASLPQVKQLADGARQLNSGLAQVNSADNKAKLAKITGAVDSFSKEIDLASQITSSADYSKLINTLASLDASKLEQIGFNQADASKLAGELTQLKNKLAAVSNLPSSGSIQQELASLTTGLDQLSQGAGAVSGGTDQLYQQLSSMAGQLNNPSTDQQLNQLADGSKQLRDGLTKLNSQMPTLVSGVNALNSGASQLANGTRQLTTGTNQLASGSNELASQLDHGTKHLKATPLSEATAQQIADPVKLNEDKFSDVKNYGHGFAPYFMAVSIFVGCMLFNFAYPMRKIADKKGSWLSWFLSKLAIATVVALAMAGIIGGVMMGIGLSVQHPAQFFGLLALDALAMMYLVTFLAVAFDNPGRFVAMLLLIVSLGAAGGTFPVETASSFYQTVHPFIPMTYMINGLRGAISGGIASGDITRDFIVLGAVAVVSVILLGVSMYLMKKYRGEMAGQSRLDDNQQLLSDDYSNYQLKSKQD